MLASILCVIFCHYILMCCIAIKKWLVKGILGVELFFGFLIYPIIIARESVHFVYSSFGWTYEFTEYPGRSFYNVFCILIGLGVIATAVYGIRFGKYKRVKLLGWYGLLGVAFMALGMVANTILPMLGLRVFPSGATAMLLCCLIIYNISMRKNVNRLTVSNVSPHIFSNIETPMLILDEEKNITSANRAAILFFQTSNDRVIEHKLEDFFETDELSEISMGQTYDVRCIPNQAECRLRFTEIPDAYGEVMGSILMITDMTDKIMLLNLLQEQHEQTKLEADIDYLTGLYNRKACEREIRESLKKEPGVLMIVDLDYFKNVNDTYGHQAGDIVLQKTAACMTEASPETAIVGREGGDEFVIFLRNLSDTGKALETAQKIRQRFREEAEKEERMRGCSLSVGISLSALGANKYHEMFQQADKALYHVKQAGRDNVSLYLAKEMSDSEPTAPKDWGQVVDIFRNAENYEGAFSVKEQEIRRIYEFGRNFAARYQYEVQIVLFTLAAPDDLLSLEEQEEAMRLFQEILQNRLRRVDIRMRYGTSQIIVILIDCTESGVPIVVQDIRRIFHKSWKKKALEVYYDAIDIRKI